ncbi:hypothetical protein [Streptomyces caniscabiei]|uniref:hypothetical protein n=1 Tax=Streptomyces caniscabiei TaxID=2746961 RepID=UPI00187243ED|nr:hypothetical protein [Streptomyces caniscabiei]MBE4790891.1 hypothetical protein [Streptomyces caniscabiei]MDX2953318.1 hypothetical protein [Streptomyces caniscabiei]MDX2987345.1 hypothetical protein [Streptomyces caniscabiei]MDX3009518.1 hypothetical protein [Streptomyces caniscabiei]
MPERIVTCRVLSGRGVRCTGEAVDPAAELKICARHLAEAQRLIYQAFQRAQRKEPTQ